jgi:hypothetical protein
MSVPVEVVTNVPSQFHHRVGLVMLCHVESIHLHDHDHDTDEVYPPMSSYCKAV